jgi:predicted 3-demethylubiquinone-9 3-methyltransferase (glyoxalase superfamily)
LEADMQKITPFLWFDGKAEEAAKFYLSVFEDSNITNIARYGDAGPGVKGAVMTVGFEIEGQPFIALNGGSTFSFSPATSFVVACQTQEEVDHYWDRLLEGGAALQCGWLTDKYGVTWQIVPTLLLESLQDKDVARSQRVMVAMMSMTKFDIAKLRAAYDGV